MTISCRIWNLRGHRVTASRSVHSQTNFCRRQLKTSQQLDYGESCSELYSALTQAPSLEAFSDCIHYVLLLLLSSLSLLKYTMTRRSHQASNTLPLFFSFCLHLCKACEFSREFLLLKLLPSYYEVITHQVFYYKDSAALPAKNVSSHFSPTANLSMKSRIKTDSIKHSTTVHLWDTASNYEEYKPKKKFIKQEFWLLNCGDTKHLEREVSLPQYTAEQTQFFLLL